MTNWELFKGTDEEWDQNVFNYDANYRQLTSWANLKKLKNWKILRLVSKNEKKTLIQIFYKKYFLVNFIYCPGGAIGSSKNLDKAFIDSVKKYTKSKVFYIRIDDSSSNLENLNFFKSSQIWSRPIYRTNESKCAYLELAKKFDTKDICKLSSRDFRYSLKRSKKKKLDYLHTCSPNSNHLVEISLGMFKKKKIKMMEYQDFEDFKFALKNNMHFVIAYDENKNPLAYRAILVLKNKAWDIAAATSLEGRKKFAGFGLFEEVLKVLKILSIDQFNLGSLTSQNRGVNEFKIGTGAKELLYVGEFEYCNFKYLAKIINSLIGFTLSKKLIGFNFLRRLYY